MTLVAQFEQLDGALRRLRDAVSAVQLTAVGDRPADPPLAFVDGLSDVLDDGLGSVDEALVSTAAALRAAGDRGDLHRARLALSRCQKQLIRFLHGSWADIYSYDRMAELMLLGQERGGEWAPWSEAVRTALERCRQPAYDVSHALAHCWEELAERSATGTVSVQATNIGQQITTPEPRDALRAVP